MGLVWNNHIQFSLLTLNPFQYVRTNESFISIQKLFKLLNTLKIKFNQTLSMSIVVLPLKFTEFRDFCMVLVKLCQLAGVCLYLFELVLHLIDLLDFLVKLIVLLNVFKLFLIVLFVFAMHSEVESSWVEEEDFLIFLIDILCSYFLYVFYLYLSFIKIQPSFNYMLPVTC